MNQHWEYRVIGPVKHRDIEHMLNLMGTEGWELVTAIVWGTDANQFYFKRSKSK